MTTQIVRRLYMYAAAFLGLQLLAVGARGIIAVILEASLSAPAVGGVEQQTFRISLYTALLIVGAPLWAGHWWWAQRTSRQPDEQHSALRRLYGFAVVLVAMLGLLFAVRNLIGTLLEIRLIESNTARLTAAIGMIVVNGALWLYHWRVFRTDRDVVEQAGATATLRRWYLVIVLGFSLGLASYSAVDLLRQLLQLIIAPAIGASSGATWGLAGLLAGLLIWLPHHNWARALIRRQTPLRTDEARSTLRQVYGALVITVALVSALGGLTTILYWLLLATFGGATWRSVVTEHTQAFAVVVIAAGVWWYHRAQLADEARRSDIVARSDTARRVIGYLTAAVGLGALYFGLGGLLSTILRLLVAPAVLGSGWRNGVSLGVALSVVALPVYTWMARAMERLTRSSPEEERTLARRIYLYAALLFGIVATIVAVVAVLRLVIGAILGTPEPNVGAEVARWLGYTVVGAAVGVLYGMLLQRTIGPRADLGTNQTIAIIADEPLGTALATTISSELPGAQLRIARTDQAGDMAEDLVSASTLIVSLAAVFNETTLRLIKAFPGRRILLATATPGYDVIGGRTDEAAIRAALRTLRAGVNVASPATPPPPAVAPRDTA